MELDLRRFLGILRQWWWLLFLGAFIAAGSGYFLSSRQPASYTSRARIIVGQTLESANPDYSSLYASQRLVKTYAELATSYPVLSGVINALELPDSPQSLAEQISATPVEETEFLDITVTARHPHQAADIANAVAEQLVVQSPTGPRSAEAQILVEVQDQIEDLKSKISEANQDIAQIEEQLTEETNSQRLHSLQARRDLLQGRVDRWQETLARLYGTFLGNRTNTLTVIEQAQPPLQPTSPNPRRSALMAGLLGLLIALSIALLLEYLDDTVKGTDEVSKMLPVPMLATLPTVDIGDEPSRLIIAHQPYSPAAESYRGLRTNLQFLSINHPVRSLLITSPGPSEGKTTVAANLALALAHADIRVILVDADLRRPLHHRIFELPNEVGLTTILIENDLEASVHECMARINSHLMVIPSGPLPPNPSELLSSKRMQLLLGALQEQADIVIVDTPPVMTVADPLALAPRCDGALIVAEHASTRRDALHSTFNSLNQVGARVLGIVLNKTKQRSGSYYYEYYYEGPEHRNGQKEAATDQTAVQ